MLAVLYWAGLTARTPFALERVAPLDAPAVLVLAFWGGVWGIALARVVSFSTNRLNYWLLSLLFGATLPTVVNWFVFAPLHGFPLGRGWRFPDMATSILVNGAWGLGTALLLRLWHARQRRS